MTVCLMLFQGWIRKSKDICNHVIKLYRTMLPEFMNDESMTTEEEVAASEEDLYLDIDEDSQEFIQITTTK